jgi:hypothetical protein
MARSSLNNMQNKDQLIKKIKYLFHFFWKTVLNTIKTIIINLKNTKHIPHFGQIQIYYQNQCMSKRYLLKQSTSCLIIS